MRLSLDLGLGTVATLNAGVGAVDAYMASTPNPFWFSFEQLDRLFQANDQSTPVTANGQTIGLVLDHAKAGGTPKQATQATAGNRPLYDAPDGVRSVSADYLQTNVLYNATTGFVMVRARIGPATGSIEQLFSANGNGNGQARLGMQATTGLIYAQLHLGGAPIVLSAGASVASTDCTIAVRWNASGGTAWVNGVQVATAPGTPAVTTAFSPVILGINNNGTQSGTSGHEIVHAIGGDVAPTDAQMLAFHNQLMAA